MATDRVSISAVRRTFAALGLLAGAVTVAGCTTSGASGGTVASVGTATGAATATGVASTSPTAPASLIPAVSASAGGAGSGSQPGTGVGGAADCLTRYLHGDLGPSQAAAGSVYVEITFKNLNNTACTLRGFPGVSLGGGTPVNQVGQPADRDSTVAPALVTLAPGGFAHARLRIAQALNYPTSTCVPVATTWLLVYPPNTSNLLYVPYNSTACSANIVTLSVQVVQAGTG
jgi:hypothetical protein